jgi:hypothetical protein
MPTTGRVRQKRPDARGRVVRLLLEVAKVSGRPQLCQPRRQQERDVGKVLQVLSLHFGRKVFGQNVFGQNVFGQNISAVKFSAVKFSDKTFSDKTFLEKTFSDKTFLVETFSDKTFSDKTLRYEKRRGKLRVFTTRGDNFTPRGQSSPLGAISPLGSHFAHGDEIKKTASGCYNYQNILHSN